MSTVPAPVVYVVRHTGGYALYPHTDDVSSRLGEGALAPADVLLAIRYLPVSLVMSSCGSTVVWADGADVSLATLAEMACC